MFRKSLFRRIATLFLLASQTVACAGTPFEHTAEYDVTLGRGEVVETVTVALATDLHASEKNLDGDLLSLSVKLEKARPDVIILSGDVLNKTFRDEKAVERASGKLIALLSTIRAPYGVYAVTGNHELPLTEAKKDIFRKSSIVMLDDAFLELKVRNAVLTMCGLYHRDWDNCTVPPKITQEMLARKVPLLVICHSPGVFDEIRDDVECLVLSGHMHGGQFNLPFTEKGDAMRLTGINDCKYIYGYYEKGRKKMIVSSGTGTENNTYPRLNSPGETVIIHLTIRKEK